MTTFTDLEIEYLEAHTLGRLATVGAGGRPHLVPATYRHNTAEDAIDIGGIDFGASKKWRDALANRRVTFLVDDAAPEGAHAIEIRGEAEPHATGGASINPRCPPSTRVIRIRPRYVVSWSIEEPGFHPLGRRTPSVTR